LFYDVKVVLEKNSTFQKYAIGGMIEKYKPTVGGIFDKKLSNRKSKSSY
jgi:hypothetical protein